MTYGLLLLLLLPLVYKAIAGHSLFCLHSFFCIFMTTPVVCLRPLFFCLRPPLFAFAPFCCLPPLLPPPYEFTTLLIHYLPLTIGCNTVVVVIVITVTPTTTITTTTTTHYEVTVCYSQKTNVTGITIITTLACSYQ